MAVSITSIVRENGAQCDHVMVTVNHEGTVRHFKTSFAEIDALSMTPGDLKDLLLRWAKYRRQQGRSVLNVEIA